MNRILRLSIVLLALAAPAMAQVTSLTYKDFLPSSRGGSVRGVLLDPGTVADNAICRWDGTGGMGTQSSVVTVSDLGAIAGTATIAGNPALLASEYAAGTTGIVWEGATADTAEGLLTFADPGSDATVTVPASTGTLALATGWPATTTFAAAAGATNIAEVTITVKDQAGVTVAAVSHLDVWLSDSATCAGITGTAASGTVQAKAASGTDVVVYTAKKSLRVETLATGVYVLEITDSAKTGYYVCSAVAGKAAASAQLVTGNYGS